MERLESEFKSSLDLSETVNQKCKAKFSIKNLKIFEETKYPNYLISNIVKCSSKDLPENLKIYGISVIDLTKPDIILETKEIKKIIFELKNIPKFNESITEFFSRFQISGNTLFGERNNTEDLEDYYFYVKSMEKRIEFIKVSKERYMSFQEGELQENDIIKHYEISFQFSFQINEIQNPNFIKYLFSKGRDSFDKYKNSILTYCNLQTKDTLKLLGYKRYDYIRNYAYYKNINHAINGHNNNFIQLNNYGSNTNSNCVYMVPGVNLTYNFYSNEILMLRSITKYKMIREDTYLDLFKSLKNNKGKFKEMVIGRHGFKTYSTKASEKFRIDDVFFIFPHEIPFENPNAEKDGIHTIFDYYKKYPNCIIDNVEQPILLNIQRRKNRITGEEIENKNFLFAKFSFILGKFDTDKLDLKPLTTSNAQEKFAQICEPLRELEKYRRNLLLSPNLKQKYENDSNSNNLKLSLKEFPAKILKDPILQTNNKESIPLGNKKRLTIENIKAFEGNNTIKNWVLLCFGVDLFQSEKLLYSNLKRAAESLGILIELPTVVAYDKHKIQKNDKDYVSFIENIFYDLAEENEKAEEEKKLELIFTILSRDFDDKNFYDLIKKSNLKSDLKLPSQNAKLDKLQKNPNLSYFTCLLIQMFAKLSRPLWRFKSPKEFDNTVILSYSVKRDLKRKKTVACIFLTLDKYFNDYFWVGEYSDEDSNMIYSGIYKLMVKAIKKLFKQQQEINENLNYFIENLIILREGVNESQKALCLTYELNKENLNSVRKLIRERTKNKTAPEPKIMVIFVNDRNDTKIFKVKNQSNQSRSGLEKFLLTEDSREITNVEYADVGTLVDYESGITLSEKEFEFYINSAFPTVGGSNFTRYSIVYNDTNLNEIVYAFTYNLCFLYFNNPQPIKMPAPLYYAIRTNNYVIDHLGFFPKEIDLTNFSL